jgi:hypothetical protein
MGGIERMKKAILASLFILTALCAVPAVAQKTDDKSKDAGTWIWRIGNSDQYFHRLEIVQKENEIEISGLINFPNQPRLATRLKHFTDGRGEKNELPDKQFSESVTNWKGNKLVFTYYRTDPANGKKKKLGTIEFSLKKDKLIFRRTSADGDEELANLGLFLNQREFVRVK